MDIEKIATGETWLGPDALANGLVDGLTTVDEVLLDRVDSGAEVLSLTYQDKPKSPLAALTGGAGGSGALAAELLAASGRGGAMGTPAWKAAALALAARMLGTDLSAAGGGGVLDGLGGGATAGDRTAAFAREVMAARPSGEAEPMLRWSGEEEAEEDDSWFL